MLKGCSSFQGRFLTVVVLIILACAVFSWVVDAQVAPTTYPLYTGTDPKPVPPAPALGPANSVITDPTFGTRILRVTDQNTDSGNSLISTETGFKRTFNADSTAIKLSGVGGKGFWLEFNAAAFKVGDGTSRPSPHPLWFGSNWEWSAVDPDIIYFLNGNKIAKYNKSTGVTTNLGGPPNGDAVTYATAVIGQDNWVCSAAGAGYQDSYTKFFCINPSNTSQYQFVDVYNKTINGAPAPNLTKWPTSAAGQVIGIHAIAPGTGSKWVYLSFHQQSWGGNGDAIFNLQSQTWSLVTNADPYWSGHATLGNGKFTNGSGTKSGTDPRSYLVRDPDDLMNASKYLFIEQPTDTAEWCTGEHPSWHNSGNNPDAPLLISRFAPTSCTGAWTGEIILAAVDGSNTVWRVAHNHATDGLNCFYGQGFAQISSDGKWALFSSTWDRTLGPDTAWGCTTRIDTFLVDLTGVTASVGNGSGSGTSGSGTSGSTSGSTSGGSTSTGTSTTTRVEETDSAVTYSGTWFLVTNGGMYSGGTMRSSMDANARATLSFTGTSVTFITMSDEWSGIAQINVDGNPTTEVDLYASPAIRQAKAYTVSGLTLGPHTIGIGPTGRKNASAQGYWTQLDAFDVTTTSNATTTVSGDTSTPSTGSSAPTSTPTTTPSTSGNSASGSSASGSTSTGNASAQSSIGGQSLTTSGGGRSMQVGSAQVTAAAGQQSVPSGVAIFGYRENGVLVAEAGVPASVPARRGRIYAEVSGSANTGLAIANANDSAATVSFFFTDTNGKDFGNGTVAIPAHGQIARFLNETPFNGPQRTEGTFTFSSSVPVSAIAIRGFLNERSEFLATTLPVADPDVPPSGSVYFPQFADGGGWITQFVLVNPSDQAISGMLSFYGQGTAGAPAPNLSMNIDGAVVSQVAYSIPAHSSKRFSTRNTSSQMKVGSARATPAAFSTAPVGAAIFSYHNAGITVSEAGTPSITAGSAFRLYAEADTSNAIQTAVAVENAGSSDTLVNFELTRLDGTSTGHSGQLVIPASGQRAVFLNQIPGFESLPMPFKGVLRISSGDANIAVLGVRSRWNERGDFIFTTTPATNESAPTHSTLVFPQIVDGGGYTTQFITFSGTPAEPPSGNLQLFTQSGGSLGISLR